MISTDKIIPGVLPPKEYTEGVNFIAILDAFDPASLSITQLQLFAGRDPYVTGKADGRLYNIGSKVYPVPTTPVEERLYHAQIGPEFDRKDLEKWAERYQSGEKTAYKNARAALIKAIGSKACLCIVEKEYEELGEDGRRRQAEDWQRWSDYCDRRREQAFFGKDPKDMTLEELEEALYEPAIPQGYTINSSWRSDNRYISLLAVKMKMVRKALGLTQRDFAKRLGTNINKYAQLEMGKIDDFPDGFIKTLVDATYANPYWLEDDEAEDADEDKTAMTVDEAQEGWHPMFADAKVIRHWWSRKV